MNVKKYLNEIIKVKIDRPMGSKHPKHNFIYPINYGFIPNTISGDGEELDCYVLGIFEPINDFEGKCIAIIHRLNDNDDKLIIVPKDKEFSNEQIEALIEFQERFFEHEIIREEAIVMQNEYKLILNIKDREKENVFIENGYIVMVREENLILVKKENDKNVNIEKEKEVIDFAIKMFKKYQFKENKIIDLSNDINAVLKRVENVEEIDYKTDKQHICWQFRNAITKALAEN